MSAQSTGEQSQWPRLAERSAVVGPRATRLAALLFAALLALALALAQRAEAYVYWTDRENGLIGRANLDGTGVDHSFITGTGNPHEAAVNSTHVYWVNGQPAGYTIGRANLDGTEANPRFIADVDVDFGSGVAIDGRHVYWVSKFYDGFPEPASGAIGRANLDGTGVDESFITGLDFPAGALAVDASHLYWTSYASYAHSDVNPPSPSRIGRANLNGTGVDEDFISAPEVGAVAVDDAHVWWTVAPALRSDESGAIWRANLDGTGAKSVIPGVLGVIGTDIFPCGLALDRTHVYWRSGFEIGRARLDGDRANHEFIGTPIGSCGVAVDGLPFSFGKLKRNRKRGTAKLTVNVPGPGELELAKTRKVKRAKERAKAQGKVKLRVKPRAKATKSLERRGKAKVKAKVTFVPDEGEGGTQTKRLKLIKRR